MTDTSVSPAIPLAACPHCGREVPVANFCGACGAHLVHETVRATRRHHAYAAFPEEPVLRLAVTSSLFPHLSHRAKVVFRTAVGLIVVALIGLALGAVEAPAIAVSALGLPLLYLLYVYEVDDPTRASLFRAVPPLVILGVGLGIGWGQIAGHYVNEALAPTLDARLVRPAALAAALAVPSIAVVLMAVPVLVARAHRGRLDESLDGFVLGAVGALAFTAAATLTQLSSLFSVGQFSDQSFVGILTQVGIRGLCSPIMVAALIGLFGASIWVSLRDDHPAGARWLAAPASALVSVLALEIGVGFADIARLSDAQLLVCHVSAVVVSLAAVRLGLHYVLLHEAGPSEVGSPSVCGHCHFVVPTMHFCPHCGVARRATARSRRSEPALALEEG